MATLCGVLIATGHGWLWILPLIFRTDWCVRVMTLATEFGGWWDDDRWP